MENCKLNFVEIRDSIVARRFAEHAESYLGLHPAEYNALPDGTRRALESFYLFCFDKENEKKGPWMVRYGYNFVNSL